MKINLVIRNLSLSTFVFSLAACLPNNFSESRVIDEGGDVEGSEEIILFDNGTDVNGALSGAGVMAATFGDPRDSADAQCQSQYDSQASGWGITCDNVLALLSFSGDAIADLPTNQGVPSDVNVETIDGGVMATDWADFMDGLNGIPSGTGFSGLASGTFWTGSNTIGQTNSTTCTNFTSSDNLVNGAYMDSTVSLAPWQIGNDTCDQTRPFLCICWND